MIGVMQILIPCVVVVCVILLRLHATGRAWHSPTTEGKRNRFRGVELFVLLATCVPLLLLLAFEARTQTGTPYFLSHSTAEPIRHAAQTAVVLVLAATAAGLIVSFRKGVGVGSVAAGFGIVFAAMLANETLSNAREVARKGNLGDDNYRLRFELPDHIEAAEIEINGVKVGSLPFETSVRELFQKIGTSSPDELDALDSDDTQFTEWSFDEKGLHGNGFSQWVECRFDLSMTFGNVVYPKGYPDHVLVRVSVGGEYGFGAHRIARYPIADGSRCVIAPRFPSREKRIKSLFDQARMTDYVVDIDWLNAYENWKWSSWDYLQRHAEQEPQLALIVDQICQHRYNVRGVINTQDAWSLLKTIGREAVKNQRYETFSVQGRTVELLLPMIDKQQLLQHVSGLVADPLSPPSMSHSWSTDGKRHYFYVGTRQDDADSLLWAPFVHACWKQHTQEQATNRQQQTTVQAAFAPVFIQAEAFQPGYSRFNWAAKLEGKTYEEFLLRHDVMAPDEHSFYGLPAKGVNRWFAMLLALDSPRGQQFRRQHQNTAFRIASRGLEEAFGKVNEVPKELSFLFVDKPEPGKPCLATAFWPVLDAFASTISDDKNGSEALDLRLDYLSKMWPASTAQMFVDAMLKVPDQHYFNPRRMKALAPKTRFKILTEVIKALQKRQGQLSKPRYAGRDAYSVIEAKIQKLNSRRMNLACPEAAALFVEYWSARSDHDIKQLEKRMAVDSIHHDHVEALASHPDPRLRSAALLAIRYHPTVRRLNVLKKLGSTSDKLIQSEANAVAGQLDSIRLAKPAEFMSSRESLE